MAVDYEPSRKEGDTRWAHQYLLDPLNAVEAWQTAQTGGQYNDVVPTQHKNINPAEYTAAAAAANASDGAGGLGRSRSLRIGSSSKAKENEESQQNLKRSTSVRNRLIRRFTDDSKDRRYATLRPLDEVPDKEISRMENTDAPRNPRNQTVGQEKMPEVQCQQSKNDFQNQENKPEAKKVEDRFSNNPFRDSMIEMENRTPPSSPKSNLVPNRTSTNPFRRGIENITPPRSPPRRTTEPRTPPPRPQSRTAEPRTPPPRTMQRTPGPRSPPNRPHSRNTEKRPPRPAQRGAVADTIDSLDTSFYGMTFHHEGPYDATLSHKNRNPHKSPVEATRYGNEMALKATARADIENSLQFGRPLDGVAAFPPGTKILGGNVINYEEYDVNRKDGNYRRFPGLQYHDEDLKGKGVEGYEGDLKEKQAKEAKHRRGKSLDLDTQTQQSQFNSKAGDTVATAVQPVSTTSLRRNGSTAGRLEGAAAKIKRKFSVRRKDKRVDEV